MRKLGRLVLFAGFGVGIAGAAALCAAPRARSATVPFRLDHNRMIVAAQVRRADGSWREARLWVDSGNPAFLVSEALARDLGVDLAAAKEEAAQGEVEISPPKDVRLGRFPLDFTGVKSKVELSPSPFLLTAGADANLPSTVLSRCRVVFDYPAGRMTLSDPEGLPPRGRRMACRVHPETGILQVDCAVDGETLSFALDMGASYTLVSQELLSRLSLNHGDWPSQPGALGCANMWGWPQEPAWPMLRLGELDCGPVRLERVGAVGLPQGLFDWYSKKTAAPVSGLLGPNALLGCRVEIDFAGSTIAVTKAGDPASHDMDLVGLTLSPEADGTFTVTGVAKSRGLPAADGVEPGDRLLRVGRRGVTGLTLGAAVDALRGKPGESKPLELERDGKPFTVRAPVQRYL